MKPFLYYTLQIICASWLNGGVPSVWPDQTQSMTMLLDMITIKYETFQKFYFNLDRMYLYRKEECTLNNH